LLPKRGGLRLKGKPVQIRRGPATVSRGRASSIHCSLQEWEGRGRHTKPASQETCLLRPADNILSRKRIGLTGKWICARVP